MRIVFIGPVVAISLLAACASSPTVPAGMKAGEFVLFKCDGGKTFQARLASDGASVRVRHEGGYELDAKGAGKFEAEGWTLLTQGPGASELLHKGKTAVKNCSAA